MTALTIANPDKAFPVLLFGAVVVTALIGAALTTRGPDTSFPMLVDARPVVLADGSALDVQVREVTVAEWQMCHEDGGCTLSLKAKADGKDYPATGISQPDAMQYVAWVNARSGLDWRLPTSAEWYEIAADVLPEEPDPIFTDPELTWASTYLTEQNRTGRALRPSGSFAVSPDGIEDLDGNVWEWTRDCYAGAAGQGETLDPDRCPAFVMGGEHEAVMSYLIRDPARGGCAVGSPPAHLGFRLVSERG